MKTENSDVYLELLNDFLSGNGFDFDNYHLCKKDIGSMMAFYGRILKPETYILISQMVIDILIEN